MGKFTVIPQNTFAGLQMDAGVLLKRFNPDAPSAPADSDIICATTGGFNISVVPTYSDLAEDVDNAPVNMKEMKHLDSWEVKIGFTSLGTSEESIKLALGAADIDSKGAIRPRRSLSQSDFADVWWVGDRADGGLVAAHLLNALSTAGFALQTGKNAKGQVTFELTGHVSIDKQNEMPIVLYSLDAEPFTEVTVAPEAGNVEMFDTLVSDMQTGVAVSSNAITGTLHYLDTGAFPDRWGAGNFLALKFSDIDPNATSVRVGLDPSQGSGLVEIINDPDKNGGFKITDKNTQKFVVVTSDGTAEMRQEFDLTGLVCETE